MPSATPGAIGKATWAEPEPSEPVPGHQGTGSCIAAVAALNIS
ncbi:MAG: hypothetical protein JWQ68_1050 [Cryobacterium sp.]|jgi:hypothetical protein|nr:hypothetical protein [Cryobacterium sp.]